MRTESVDGQIDPRPLVGTWLNRDPSTLGIALLVVTVARGRTRVRMYSSARPRGINDLGTAWCELFAAGSDGGPARGWRACFDFGFKETLLTADLEEGILAVMSCHSFKDESGRSAYVQHDRFKEIDPITDRLGLGRPILRDPSHPLAPFFRRG